MDGSSLINQQHRAHDRVNAAGTQCQKNKALVTKQVAKSNNTAASNLNQNQEHSKESSSINRDGTEKTVTTSTYINFTPISRLQLRPASRSKQNLQQQQQSSPQSGSTRSLGSVSRAHVESCRCTKCRQLRRRKRREIPQLLYKTNRNLLIDLTLEAQGIKPTSGTNWHVLWTNQFRMHNFHALRKDQKVNQFPRTFEITRKDQLCRNILRMQEVHGKRHFDFLPESFVLPRDWDALRIQAAKATGGDNKPFWIAKPAASACGKGIFITQDINRIDTSVVAGESNLLVSKYIHNPLLLDGRKFDLRVYVAVTSFNPLKVYIYDEGLVRLATEQYVCNSENISNRFVHLTNYSVQKHSKSFLSCPTNTNSTVGAETVKHNDDSLTKNEDVDENSNVGMRSETRSGANDRLTDAAGVVDSESSAQIDFEATSEKCLPNSSRAESITHCDTEQLLDSQQFKESPHSEAVNEFPEEKAHKWSFDTLRNRMARDGVDTTSLWEQIEDIVIKTLISIEDQVVAAIQMHVRYPSTNCFQLFGFDILVDDKMKPWLLEVNLSPSLACDSALDFDIKSNLISDLFNLTGVRKATNPSTTTSKDHQGTGQDDPRFELLSRQESSTRRKQVPRSAPAAAQTPEQRELARIKRAIRNLVEENERAGRWKRAYPTRKWSKYNSYFEEVREMNVALGKYLEAARKF